jgi:hypothetical protein
MLPRPSDSSLPEDSREQRRIRNRLMLAAAIPLVQLLRWLFR